MKNEIGRFCFGLSCPLLYFDFTRLHQFAIPCDLMEPPYTACPDFSIGKTRTACPQLDWGYGGPDQRYGINSERFSDSRLGCRQATRLAIVVMY